MKTRLSDDARGSVTSGGAALPLRIRKKARQRADLLRVAAESFRRLGYEKTRMEDIAVQADVSTPTVYNYFTNKREILIELLTQDRRATHAAFDRVVNEPADEPADAFAELIHANVAGIRSAEDKRLWRELIAAVAISHDRERDPFEDNHEVFKEYIKRLLQHFIDRGRIARTISLSLAADIIFALNANNLRDLVSSESCTPERIRKLTRQQISLLMADWRGDQPRQPAIGQARKRPRPMRDGRGKAPRA
jgi:AcrR family transcriptional regulator